MKDSIELVKKEKSFFNFRSGANRFSQHGPVLLFNRELSFFLEGRDRVKVIFSVW